MKSLIALLFIGSSGVSSHALDCSSSKYDLRYPNGREAVAKAFFADPKVITMDTSLYGIDNPNNLRILIRETLNRVAMPIAFSLNPNADDNAIQSTCVKPLIDQLDFNRPQFGGHHVEDYYDKLEVIQSCLCH
jgi:hypothetical protein